ncbi:TrmH family RNA methyltransferase [Bacteroidota bacterium]
MEEIRTENRIRKVKSVLKSRQLSLGIILENIHDPHNVSAIFRTCDAVGLPKITLLYTHENFPQISKVSSASARKWISTERFTDVHSCFNQLRKNGFKIYASLVSEEAKNLYNLDLTEKIALIFGNEHQGVTEEISKYADDAFFIPMKGMVQSLNVSVAVAVALYEALRQRELKDMYNKSELTDTEYEKLLNDWSKK